MTIQHQHQHYHQTYEESNASKSMHESADPIHWSPSHSYRDKPYRKLHHQNNTIGTFHVRLLEASSLTRSHWSVLGMGPVKLLGLSHAVGEVSSRAEFHLSYGNGNDNGNGKYHSCQQNGVLGSMRRRYHDESTRGKYKSSTIPSNDNPIWPSVQTDQNVSLFDIPLQKGAMPLDGMSIYLEIRMKEEQSVADALLQPVPLLKLTGTTTSATKDYSSNYRNHSNISKKNQNDVYPHHHHQHASGMDPTLNDGVLLGAGSLNITPLVLGRTSYSDQGNAPTNNESHQDGRNTNNHDPTNTMMATSVDIWDQWIDLHNHQDDPNSNNNTNYKSQNTPRVRVLLSYTPNGISPQKGDIVALETFARFSSNNASFQSVCDPILPPLHPLRVLDIRGEQILVEFIIHAFGSNHQEDHHTNTNTTTTTIIDHNNHRKGRVAIHRNTVFVIERTNIVDSALHTAFLPADVILSTPMGKGASTVLAPYIESVGDIIMPAILSGKLLFEAAKIGGFAAVMGMKTAAFAVLNSQDPQNKKRARRRSFG